MASIYKAKNGPLIGQLVVGYYSAGTAKHKTVSGRTKPKRRRGSMSWNRRSSQESARVP